MNGDDDDDDDDDGDGDGDGLVRGNRAYIIHTSSTSCNRVRKCVQYEDDRYFLQEYWNDSDLRYSWIFVQCCVNRYACSSNDGDDGDDGDDD